MEKILRIDDEYSESTSAWSGRIGACITTTEQEIKILIDDGQCCCENFGSVSSEDDFSDFIGAQVLSVHLTDTQLASVPFEMGKYFDGGVMFVNIDTDRGTLQFVLYNEHNGYYSHGAYVISNQLTTEDSL